MGRATAFVLIVVMATGCATGRAVRSGQGAAKRGDWDAAVAFYRQALGRDPGRVDVKIALERATRMASAEHVRRARELEGQEQLSGAVAEYRLAADLDSTNTLALTKAVELDRRIREQVEASRPQSRISDLRQQAQLTSNIPRLDPRIRVPTMRYPNGVAVRDLLKTISDLTSINISYDQGLDSNLSRSYALDIQDMSLEEVLNQVLQANQLTFKVLNQRTIFIYQDTQAKRQLFEDQFTQTFYVSNADVAELVQILNQMVQQGPAVRPNIYPSKTANAIVVRATAPVMDVIEQIIRSNDKPKPEVMIEAEILEVDRSFIRQLGLDLTNYALGFTFSPEVAPPNTSGSFPPGNPPPFNLNTVSQGVSAADFYGQAPTALIRLLESNTKTKVLAKPQIRGRDGAQVTLNLGDEIPVPQTTFQANFAGGAATTPATQVQYRQVGINLLFMPRVTYDDEIIIENLTLEKSGLGSFINVAGQSYPTFISRRALTSLRLRDGESNLIAGLLRDEDRKTLKSLPGITNLPILRSLLGNSDAQVEQTDIVMIITPHIVRGHDLRPQDLKPLYIGTGQNFGTGGAPALISPGTPLMSSGVPAAGTQTQAGGTPPNAGVPGQGASLPPPGMPPASSPSAPPPATGAPSRAPGIVPIQPVTSSTAPPTTPTGPAQISLTAPLSPDGTLAAGGGPYIVPVTISNTPAIGTLTLTITYDPTILRAVSVTQGTFMSQGGVTPTFAPQINATAGRIDIAINRPSGSAALTTTSGLLAAITFQTVAPGTSAVGLTGVASSPTGQAVQVRTTPTSIVVK